MAAPAIRLADPNKFRFEIRQLERSLSTAESSLERGPLEDALKERKAKLRSHYLFVRGLRGGGNPKTLAAETVGEGLRARQQSQNEVVSDG